MVEDIRRWLLVSGVDPSHPWLERAILRFAGRLREMGITQVMPPMITREPADDRVSSLLCLWTHQAKAPDDRNPAVEHELRNLTRTRPWKA